MEKTLKMTIATLALTVFATNLTACSSEQIYGDDSFAESSTEYAEGEDVEFDIDGVQAEAAKDLHKNNKSAGENLKATSLEPIPTAPTGTKEKPKTTSSTKKKKQSL